MSHICRAYPHLLRVEFAAIVTYRAHFLISVLTAMMPVVQLAFWVAVAKDDPVRRFSQADFCVYYVAVLVVRIVTSSTLVWQLTTHIRHGELAVRLLRPLSPLVSYTAHQLAGFPLRAVAALPLLIVVSTIDQRAPFLYEPWRLALVVVAIAGAWWLLFFTMVLIASLAFFVDRAAMAVFDLWLVLHSLLSGYLVPIELFPAWAAHLAGVLPFRYMLGFPAELATGLIDLESALSQLARQWAYVALFAVGSLSVWRAGLRRFVGCTG